MDRKTFKVIFWSVLALAAAFEIGMHMDKLKTDAGASGYIGPSAVNVENGVMTPRVLLSLGRLSDPVMSPDGSTILYGVTYTSVEKNASCRNLFACTCDGSSARQLTRECASVSNARWSLDGRHVFFLQKGQIYRAAYRGDRLGCKQCISDVADGVDAFELSPDQSKLLYISSIPGPVKCPADSDPALDKAQAYVAEDLMYRHWDHWVTRTPRTYVATLGKDRITKENSTDLLGADEPFELPTEPFGGMEQLSWSPDGSLVAYSCRKKTGIEYAFSTDSDIYLYDVASGRTERISQGGGYDTDPVWSPDGAHLVWISMERDGYEADRQRIMICDKDGSNRRELTEGFVYDAASLTWTPDSKSVLFPTTIDGVGAVCSVNAEGVPAVRVLTPREWMEGYSSVFAPKVTADGLEFFTTAASMTRPSEIVKVEISGDEALRTAVTDENGRFFSAIAPISQERVTILTPQGENLYCWVLYPSGFDPAKTYPVVEMFNGGPQTSLDQSWSYRWNFMMMAQQGYVVLLPNRHGDSGFGQAWKEQISGDYQGLNMQDYLLAAHWAKEQSWCGRIGGVGASYGGFSVYNIMGIHGDLFDCFIAHAGIFDEKAMWYTTEEAWFGNWDNGGLREYAFTPGQTGPADDGITFGGMQQAGAPYADVAKTRNHYAHDPESKVTAWHTPILCMHGMMDYRIPYEQGMAAFNAARMMGVPSKLIVFPEENHWILKPQNALFWHREFFAWLDKYLKD